MLPCHRFFVSSVVAPQWRGEWAIGRRKGGGCVNKNKAKVLFLFTHTVRKEEDASPALGVSFVVGFVPREGHPRTLHWEEVHWRCSADSIWVLPSQLCACCPQRYLRTGSSYIVLKFPTKQLPLICLSWITGAHIKGGHSDKTLPLQILHPDGTTNQFPRCSQTFDASFLNGEQVLNQIWDKMPFFNFPLLKNWSKVRQREARATAGKSMHVCLVFSSIEPCLSRD